MIKTEQTPAQGNGRDTFLSLLAEALRPVVAEEVRAVLYEFRPTPPEPVKEPEPVMHSIRRVCELTSLSKPTVYALIHKGTLQPVRIGRRTLIPDDQLRPLLEAGIRKYERRK